MRVLAVLAALLLAGCLDAAIPPETGLLAEAAPNVLFERIHTPEEIAAAVEAYAAFPGVAVEVLGDTEEGRPLHRVTVGEGPFVLWAVGRHHGNEPTGAEAILLALRMLADPDARLAPDAPAILHDLLAHRDLVKSRVTLVTVPVVNPDGAAAFTRGNARTPDPNRDYAAFPTIESRLVRDAFWSVRPDACLDLHNEGLSDRFDYDAFVPDGLPESDVQRALVAHAWRAVHEVDAAGGFGGGPNENYQLMEGVANPTAYHPGTHDMFCSLRGAPGWTPEGAIPPESEGGGNGGAHATYAWSTRLHLVTLGAALLDAAGAYDGLAAPVVVKTQGTLEGAGALATVSRLAVPLGGRAHLQVVWKPAADPVLSLVPVGVEFRTPTGEFVSAGLPAPGAYTATAVLARAPAGEYHALLQGPPGTAFEFRVRVAPEDAPPIRVTRGEDGLLVENLANRPLDVRLADVADPTEGAFAPAPDARLAAAGSIAARLLLTWDLVLAPGEAVEIAYPAMENAGPWRWTATDGRSVATGVEGVRSTQ